jgi:hypothetical protein
LVLSHQLAYGTVVGTLQLDTLAVAGDASTAKVIASAAFWLTVSDFGRTEKLFAAIYCVKYFCGECQPE